ncbi:MAG: hypothetical protein EP311_00135 [Cytophagales bacterium]|nr:MAG: hypothetical protein EP311_00135 [Cytophagales bacterium]
MARYLLFFFFLMIFLSGCEENETPLPGNEEVFWIYSYHWPCDPFNDDWSPCFAIQKNEEFDYSKIINQSETVGLGIKNFGFEEGNLYKIKARVSPKPNEEITLIEILEKRKDYIQHLLGNWQIIEVYGTSYPNADFPDYEGFSIYSGPRMISGSNGCYMDAGILGEIGPEKIEIIVPTKPGLYCDKWIDSGKAINEAVRYQLNNNILRLYDSQGILTMRLKKS